MSDSDEDREIKLPSPKRTRTDICVRNISNTNEEKTHTESSKQHTEVCIEYLSNKDLWQSLVQKLNDSGNLVDFVTLIKCLHSGAIPMDNIVFLLMLERAKFGARQNTCGMRYREVTKLFWSIVYRLCKSSGLKFFSGPKNWGQVVSKETSKGHYKGVNSKINFAVPNEKMLRSINNKLPKVIPPGIIEKSLHLLRNQKDVILMADGKLVSKGLGSNFLGDVNLFGHETNPNLRTLEDELWKYVCFVSDSVRKTCTVPQCDRYTNICEITEIMTTLMHRIREYMELKRKKLNNMPNTGLVNPKVLSKLKTEIYTAQIWIQKVRVLNVRLLKLLSSIQTNDNLFSDNCTVELTTEPNIRMLHEAQYVQEHIDIYEFPHLIKKGSDTANDIIKQSTIQSIEAYDLLGLSTTKKLRRKFKIYITEEIPMDVEQFTDYTPNVDAIATTCKLFLPAYLPSCTLFYEEGVRLMNGLVVPNLLSCRPAGIVRHNHGIPLEQFKCNQNLNNDHENFCVLVNTEPACFGNIAMTCKPCKKFAVNCLVTMRLTQKLKCLYVTVGTTSVSFCFVTFEQSVWKKLYRHLRDHYDQMPARIPDKLGELKHELNALLDTYIQQKASVICELPRLRGVEQMTIEPQQFSAYVKPAFVSKSSTSILLEDDFEIISYDVCRLIEEGFNHLRVEASEILAFVATNPHRITVQGIPPHLPIAYGLRGHSMTTTVMRSMLCDIMKKLDEGNISVLCEVYDGQFHKLITRDANGEPLTRLQFQLDYFKKIMKTYDKKDLLNELLPYSSVNQEDLDELTSMPFHTGCAELESITVHMTRQGTIKKFLVCSNEIGNFTFGHFQTRFRSRLWNKLLNPEDQQQQRPSSNNQLTNNELMDIIRGTRFHRQQMFASSYNDFESSDSESDDPDYEPSDLLEYSSESDSNEDINISLMSNISTTSTTAEGETCISKILDKLQKLKTNKHNWRNHDLNSFLRDYLSSKECINKLFLYELDVINKEVFLSYGKYLFNPKDKKQVRVEKLSMQLRKIPNLFTSTIDEQQTEVFEPRSLKDIYYEYIMSKLYPKEYIAAAYCEVHNLEEVKKWENKTKVPIEVNIEGTDIRHIIFNYPEFNSRRDKFEMRTFDYTHILNNLRFHICNKGFANVSREAFIAISDKDHELLPRAIVEEKLDRQNASISKRFFSAEVEQCLQSMNYHSEAQFVRVTRNWFNACDERGIPAYERLSKLSAMYHYLLNLYTFSEYPPETTHIQGIPIKTFEALLHTISTRYILYGLSSSKTYNNRAISTLAVESFFSDLNRFEFSGLGAPKSVDIPKLISHVVHVNTTKHDPKRGFEFTTSTRDNYPCHLMELEQHTDTEYAVNHPFDEARPKSKKQTKRLFSLSKPKQITKGGRGIRQFFKIDESRLTDEQRYGRSIDISNLD